jgi:uncharacterized protein YlzI (FlbEa/FlbD family)
VQQMLDSYRDRVAEKMRQITDSILKEHIVLKNSVQEVREQITQFKVWHEVNQQEMKSL